jgi:hypothetical protein
MNGSINGMTAGSPEMEKLHWSVVVMMEKLHWSVVVRMIESLLFGMY